MEGEAGCYVYEGDVILLSCADGYVSSLPPASVYSTVSSIRPLFDIDEASADIYSVAFQVLTSESKNDILEQSQIEAKYQRIELVYGKKIKLYHVVSKKYLSFSETNKERNATGITNRGFLDDKPYKFKIFPSADSSRIKGDTIHKGDQIILESVEKKEHHILTVNNEVAINSFELKMAMASTVFTINSQGVWDSSNSITGGSGVWFYNSKKGTYLCWSTPDELLDNEDEFRVYNKKKKTASVQTVSSDCWWQLQKPDDPLDSSPINSEEVYIKHMLTGRYLAIDHSNRLILADDVKVRFQLSMCQRSGHTRSSRTINTTSLISVISKVNRDNLGDFYYVESVKGVLLEYYDKMESNLDVEFMELKSVLIGLKLWLTTDPVNLKNIDQGTLKNRVKLLRNTQCIDILVIQLDIVNEKNLDVIKSICDVLYAIAKAKSHKTHLYMTKGLFLSVYISKILHCIDFLSVLVEDESSVAHSLANSGSIFELTLDATTLNFLARLCVVNGFPEKSVQKDMCQKIIKKEGLFFHVEKGQDGKIYVNNRTGSKHLLSAFHLQADFDFFIAQISLFSNVCKGINRYAIEIVSRKLAPPSTELEDPTEDPFEVRKKIEAHHLDIVKAIILSDSSINTTIKSAYLKLISAMYLDDIIASCGFHIDYIWKCYFWENLKPKFGRQPLYGSDISTDPFETSKHPNVDLVKDIINSVKQDLLSITDYNYADQMLAVMEPVIAYGFCWNVKEVPNQQKFSGQTVVDFLKPLQKQVQTEDIAKMQVRALRLLQLFFNQYIHLYVEQFLYQFYDYMKSGKAMPNIEAKNKAQLEEFSECAFKCLKALNEYSFFDYNSGDGKTLVNILKSLMECNYEDLRITSAQLLYDIYNREIVMLTQAERSYIIHIGDHDELFGELTLDDDIKKMYRDLYFGSEKEDKVNDSEDIHEYLSFRCDELNSNCPDAVLQHIYYTTGMFTALMAYVLKFCASHSDERKSDLFKGCCQTLQLLCRANPKIQASIASNLSDFMKINMAVSSVARLQTEVFTNNKDLSDSLSDTDISQLYQLASKGNQENTKEYMEFFTTLEAIMMPCKLTGVPLKRIQVIVIKLFSETHADYYKSINKRQVLETYDDDEVELLMCLHLTSLMSVCCVGTVSIAETICHSCITVEHLLDIVMNNNIACLRKIPFVHLLVNGFLCSERKSIKSFCLLASKREFWQFSIKVDIPIQGMPIEEIIPVQDAADTTQTTDYPLIYYQTQEEIFSAVTIEGHNHYLIEGLCPLLRAFCNHEHLKRKKLTDLESKIIIPSLQKFGSSLMSLLNSRKSVMLTTQTQVAFWSDCLASINNIAPIKGYIKDDYNNGHVLSKATDLAFNSELEAFISNYRKVYCWLHPTNKELAKCFPVTDSTDSRSCTHRLFARCFAETNSSDTSPHPDTFLCDLLDAVYNQLCRPITSKERARLLDTVSTTLKTLCSIPVNKDFSLSLYSALRHLFFQNDEVTINVLGFIHTLIKHANKVIDKMDKKLYHFLVNDALIFLAIHNFLARISQLGYEELIIIVEVPTSSHPKQLAIPMDGSGDGSIPLRDMSGNKKLHPSLSHSSTVKKNCILSERGRKKLNEMKVVLKAISTLCDGQKWQVQGLMREQPLVSVKSVNIVSDVIELLQSLITILNSITDTTSSDYNLVRKITTKAIQALIEMCSGNYDNQKAALNGQVVDSINSILDLVPLSNVKCDNDIKVHSKAIELLQILLEETDERSRVTILTMSKDLNKKGIIEFIKYINKMDKALATKFMKRSMYRGYHVLRYLADFLEMDFLDFITKSLAEEDKLMWKKLEKGTSCIEINYITKEDKPIFTNVYFPYDPSDKWSDDEKDKLQDEVVRDSSEAKLRDLLKWTDSALEIDKHKKKLHNFFLTKHFISLSSIKELILHWILIILTLLLNFIVLGIFEIPSTHNCTNDDINSSNNTEGLLLIPRTWECWSTVEMVFLYGFGIIHLVLAVWMMVRYFIKEWPNFVFSIPFIREELYNLKASVSKDSKKVSDFFENHFTFDKEVESQCFNIYFFGLYSMYRIVFVISSLLGLTTYGYFYCLCLPYIFIKVNVIQHLVKAVGGKAIQLLFVALLILCILLIYAVLSFAIMSSFFDISENLFCDSLWECYVTVIREGLVNSFGGAIPVTYVEQSGHRFNIYFWRSVIDISFFVIVSVIALEIITAILVDTFSQLREQKEAAEKDQKEKCFICGVSSDTFGTEFSKHYRDHHNMYNYIYYVIYINSMLPEDHNAIEKYVYEKVNKKSIESIDFFPLKGKE